MDALNDYLGDCLGAYFFLMLLDGDLPVLILLELGIGVMGFAIFYITYYA